MAALAGCLAELGGGLLGWLAGSSTWLLHKGLQTLSVVHENVKKSNYEAKRFVLSFGKNAKFMLARKLRVVGKIRYRFFDFLCFLSFLSFSKKFLGKLKKLKNLKKSKNLQRFLPTTRKIRAYKDFAFLVKLKT